MIHPIDYGEVRFFRMARTFLGRSIYWTGVYYVDGLLVDSGPPNLSREVRALCREIQPRQAVTTHHHEDHSGNNSLLRAEFGITPLVDRAALPLLARPESNPHLYRRVVWGVPSSSAAEILAESIETPSFRFRVIPTPGHAPDHVALFEPERRWLFTGDAYLAPRLKVLREDEDIYALLESLRRMMALEPDLLFCQHRGVVENGTAQLRLKLDFLTELGERIGALSREGLPEGEIARRLGGSDLFWRVGTRGHFSKRNFVRAFLRPRSR